jgi:excisionase family DNA binding protein
LKTPSADETHKLAYGVIEATRVAGIGRSTLYQAMASGELKAVKLGRRTLIPADELRRFLSELPPARPLNGDAA